MSVALKYRFFILFVTITYGEDVDRKNSCADCKSIFKCCSENLYVVDSECETDNISRNFSDLQIYDKNLKESSKFFDDVFVTNMSTAFDKSTFVSLSDMNLSYYLVEDGDLHVKSNTTDSKEVIYTKDHFCIDHYALQYPEDNDTEINFWLLNPKETYNIEYFRILGLLVSCVLFTIILIIYFLLEKHKTLAGKITMAMLISLLTGFSMFATLLIFLISGYEQDMEFCLAFSVCLYFFLLSSFCWMNVWSYDIWRCLKSFEAPAIGGQNRRFLVYGLYAWGVPMALSVMLIVLNQIDLQAVIKPLNVQNGCFLRGYEKFIYLYVPMLIINLFSWMFFFMTIYTLWTSKTGTTKLKNRVRLYFKLSLLMGISWIFEVMNYPCPEFEGVYVIDLYIMLVSVAMFITLIWSKKMRTDIKERFKRRNYG